MASDGSRPAPSGRRPVRHWLAFLVSGGVAFTVDAAVLKALTAVLELHPILARLAAIALAMVAGWLMHRTYTFEVEAPPSLPEFVRYAGVAWTSAALNYAVFVLVVLVHPAIDPLAALVVSSLAAMTFAYLGMRFGAFRHRGNRR